MRSKLNNHEHVGGVLMQNANRPLSYSITYTVNKFGMGGGGGRDWTVRSKLNNHEHGEWGVLCRGDGSRALYRGGKGWGTVQGVWAEPCTANPHPMNRQTTENITFPQITYVGGKIC